MDHHHQINCQDVLAQLSSYIDGELDSVGCANLEAHLEDCDDCRIVFNTLKKTIELCKKGIQHTTLPISIKKRLLDNFTIDNHG